MRRRQFDCHSEMKLLLKKFLTPLLQNLIADQIAAGATLPAAALDCDYSALGLTQSDVVNFLEQATNEFGDNIQLDSGCVIWGGKSEVCQGVRIGSNVRLYRDCRLVVDQVIPESGILLEDGVALNFGCYIDGSGGVRIQKKTVLGPNVVIVSSMHRIVSDLPLSESGKKFASVNIGPEVAIGANSVILAGVHIGAGSAVASGSVVARDVPKNSVVAGNPARVVRRIRKDSNS